MGNKVICPACGKIQTISRNTAICRNRSAYTSGISGRLLFVDGRCDQRIHHRKDKYED